MFPKKCVQKLRRRNWLQLFYAYNFSGFGCPESMQFQELGAKKNHLKRTKVFGTLKKGRYFSFFVRKQIEKNPTETNFHQVIEPGVSHKFEQNSRYLEQYLR